MGSLKVVNAGVSAWTPATGALVINKPTGNVSVQCVADGMPATITVPSGANYTITSDVTGKYVGETISLTIHTTGVYEFNDAEVTASGATISDAHFVSGDVTTIACQVTITDVNVVISGNASKTTFSVSYTFSNLTAKEGTKAITSPYTQTVIKAENAPAITLTPATGYYIPDSTIVGNAPEAGWGVTPEALSSAGVPQARILTETAINENRNITITPVKVFRTLKFNLNTLTTETIANKTVEYGNNIQLPSPTKTPGEAGQYVFAGWTTSAVTPGTPAAESKTPDFAPGASYMFEENVVDEVTLYALWKTVTYTIIFACGNFAYVVKDGVRSYNSVQFPNVKYGDALDVQFGVKEFGFQIKDAFLPDSPSIGIKGNGVVFTVARGGVSSSDDNVTSLNAGESTSISNLPLVKIAKVTGNGTITFTTTAINYTLHYEGNAPETGITVTVPADDHTLSGEDDFTVDDNGTTISPAYYTFAGWFDSQDRNQTGKTLQPSQDLFGTGTTLTLTAHWTPKSYPVSFSGTHCYSNIAQSGDTIARDATFDVTITSDTGYTVEHLTPTN